MAALDNRLSILTSRLKLIGFGLLYIVAILVSYRFVDSRLFSYIGLTFREFGTWQYVGVGLAATPLAWMPAKLTRPSQISYWILYVTVIVPVMIVPFHTLDRDPYEILTFSLAFLFSYWALGLIYLMPLVRIPRPAVSQEAVLTVLVIAIASFALVVWATNGFKLNLGMADIYERRIASREVVAQGSLVGYIRGNLAGALIPFGIAVGFMLRSKILLAVSLFATVVLFSVEGSRSAAALPIFMVALLPFVPHMKKALGHLTPISITLLIVIGTVIFTATGHYVLSALTSWRIVLVKGLLTGYYFDFFSTHGYTYMTDGVMRFFMPAQYDMSSSKLIGREYFINSATNANANIWAAGFADFGYFGLLSTTLIAGLLFRFIDSLAANRNFLVAVLVAAVIGIKLSDVALDSAFLSHGLLLTLILLYLMPAEFTRKRERAEP